MEKNYYFVIGQRNLMVVEAIKLLVEHKLPFKCLEAPYIFTKDEEDELIAQGFVPYYVGVAYRGDCYYHKITDAFLYKLLVMLNKGISDWPLAVLEYCCGNSHLGRGCVNVQDLIMGGYKRQEIEHLQTENRKALGFDEKAEASAQQALDEALAKAPQQPEYLVVNWDFKVSDVSFEGFLPILDRVFWLQRFVNVVIFAQNCAFYFGYQRIARALMPKWGCSSFCFGQCSAALYASDDVHKAWVAECLAAETAKLKAEGLLW